MRKIVVVVLSLFIACVSCGDETPRSTIPVAPVNFTVDLNGLDHSLKGPLSYQIYGEEQRRLDSDRFGFAGLLLVSDVMGNMIYAYDLCCPYEDKREIKVVPRNDGKAECPVCGTVYITMYGFGTPESGPSSEALQRYNVQPLRQGVYRVTN